MIRNRFPAAIALVVLVLLSGCMGAFAADDAASSASTSNRTVNVAATGQVSAEANQAVVRAAVVAHGDDAETARKRLAENASRLREGLADAGVDSSQITTSGYDIRQEYRDRREKTNQEPSYVARQSFAITLNDTSRAGEIIDVAVQNGATRIDGVRFTLSTQRRDELKQAALEDAMDRARTKAETLAAQSDMTIVEATTVTSTEYNHGPVYAEATAVADSGGSTNIDGGPVTVTATVNVVYEAE